MVVVNNGASGIRNQELMISIKKYKEVIAIVLIVLILVLIRTLGTSHFKKDAKKWVEPSVKGANIISPEMSRVLKGKKLIINLDKEINEISDLTGNVQNIPADLVLGSKYFIIREKHDGPVLLYSKETEVSVRIWMILSQMGCSNIYILTKNTDNEILKYKFRPESLASRPEL
jgi:hypothetical protein